MNTYTLTFDPTGWLEINYIQITQLPDIIVPEVQATMDSEGNELTGYVPEHTIAGELQQVVLQCTSYHPTQLNLIQDDCEKHGVLIEGLDAEVIANWIADYVPEPEPEPIVIPQEVTALQGLLAIDSAGLSDVYEEWAISPNRTFAQKAFINKAQVWRRSDSTLLEAANAIGLSSNDLDRMFIIASEL